jgi:hypothetical protein
LVLRSEAPNKYCDRYTYEKRLLSPKNYKKAWRLNRLNIVTTGIVANKPKEYITVSQIQKRAEGKSYMRTMYSKYI